MTTPRCWAVLLLCVFLCNAASVKDGGEDSAGVMTLPERRMEAVPPFLAQLLKQGSARAKTRDRLTRARLLAKRNRLCYFNVVTCFK